MTVTSLRDWQQYLYEQGPQRAADLLVASLTDRHAPDDALDDVVHDAASTQASTVNYNGTQSQVEYLIEHLGIAAAADAINDATRGSAGVNRCAYTRVGETANPALDSDHRDTCIPHADMRLPETVDPNGLRVIFNPDRNVFMWANTGAELTFDECEALGLDGTDRSVTSEGRHAVRAVGHRGVEITGRRKPDRH
jgi:hypothetical protein